MLSKTLKWMKYIPYPCPELKFPKSCHRGQQQSMMSPALPTDFKQMTTATAGYRA